MQINLIFYAVLEELISQEPIMLKVNNDCTAEQLLILLSEKYPKANDILKSTRLAHEEEYVHKKTLLREGEEYCLIPPVSGG